MRATVQRTGEDARAPVEGGGQARDAAGDPRERRARPAPRGPEPADETHVAMADGCGATEVRC